MRHSIQIGVIGYGTIGHGVVHGLLERRKLIDQRTGIELNLKWVCDRKFLKNDVRIKGVKTTAEARDLIDDPQLDIIVELIGGIEPARTFVSESLKAGKHVVTANKALIADSGKSLFAKAKRYDRELYFEAAVGGGIPIIKGLREGLVDNLFDEIVGILNGTSNYILTEMRLREIPFAVALKEAQELGYAEADPTLDVGGHDAAHKLALLAWLAFGLDAPPKRIHTEGIEHIEPLDIRNAEDMGYFIKHLAIAKRSDKGLEVRVHPALVQKTGLLANVEGVFNAVYINGDRVGDQLFYGKGAGEKPTASAVIADIVDISKKLRVKGLTEQKQLKSTESESLPLCKMGEVVTRYYLRFSVSDKPGVMAKIAGILGRNQISIARVAQEERNQESVPVMIVTHEAVESNLKKALTQIDKLSVIKKPTIVLRIEDS